MSDTNDPAKPVPMSLNRKKSVALSGVPAGNTALCTVGKSGNDLHYRGYDIPLIWRNICEFEEVAHLLIHGKLPTRDELAAYKTKTGKPCAVYRLTCVPTVLEAFTGSVTPDGCYAHRRFRARLHAARKRGAYRLWRAGYCRQTAGVT